MKKLFGILMMALVVSVAGCATNVEKGDELAQQGKYEEASKLYEQVKSDDEEYGKAQEGIANCNFQLGEIAFNEKNFQKAIALYRKAATPEVTDRISACNFQLGEIAFNARNLEKAINLYEKAATQASKGRIASCYFQLGEIEFNAENWEKAISLYSTSNSSASRARMESIRQAQRIKHFESDLRKHTEHVNNQQWDQIMEMMDPRSIDMVGKENVRNLLELGGLALELSGILGMKQMFKFGEIDNVSQLVEHENKKYCKIQYHLFQVITQTGEIAGGSGGNLIAALLGAQMATSMRHELEQMHGKENVRFDEPTSSLEVYDPKTMVAIADKNRENWKYIDAQSSFGEATKLIPLTVRQQLH